jgi:hypothetical protein
MEFIFNLLSLKILRYPHWKINWTTCVPRIPIIALVTVSETMLSMSGTFLNSKIKLILYNILGIISVLNMFS